jgi:hypothetical protein
MTMIEYDDSNTPPFLRAPEKGTREASVWMINLVDAKIEKLVNLGLKPHSTILDYRLELVGQLKAGGPYKLRLSSEFF